MDSISGGRIALPRRVAPYSIVLTTASIVT